MTNYTEFQLNRARALMPDILDALKGLLDQAKVTSAWDDAMNGEDDAMITAVNAAEKALAMVSGAPFTPHEPEAHCQGDPRCWRVKHGKEYACSCAEYADEDEEG